jgi:hypothetical protein
VFEKYERLRREDGREGITTGRGIGAQRGRTRATRRCIEVDRDIGKEDARSNGEEERERQERGGREKGERDREAFVAQSSRERAVEATR